MLQRTVKYEGLLVQGMDPVNPPPGQSGTGDYSRGSWESAGPVWYIKFIQKILGIRWTTVVQGVDPEDSGHLQDQLYTGAAPVDPAYPCDSVVQGVDPEDPGHLQDQLYTGAAPVDPAYPWRYRSYILQKTLDIRWASLLLSRGAGYPM